MDLEPDPVAGRVDEATRRRIGRVLFLSGTHRVVAGSPDEVLDKLVDLASGHTRTECLDAGVLRPTNEVIDLSDFGGRFAFRDGARHVRPITRLLVLREDVHDDRLARMERAGPDLVRIGGLRTRRADRAFGSVPAF